MHAGAPHLAPAPASVAKGVQTFCRGGAARRRAVVLTSVAASAKQLRTVTILVEMHFDRLAADRTVLDVIARAAAGIDQRFETLAAPGAAQGGRVPHDTIMDAGQS